jgi:P-type Cu+ transporter
MWRPKHGGRASEAITKLLTLEAKTARIIRNGKEMEVNVKNFVGDVMLVRPGEKIPTDGTVVDGKGSVDEAMVTGESNAGGSRKRRQGDRRNHQH